MGVVCRQIPMAGLVRALVPLSALMAVGFVDAAAKTGTIYITRHADRPDSYACLSEKGWRRAANLVNIFNGTEKEPRKMFSFHYYAAEDTPRVCQRCWQTLVPVASSIARTFDLNIVTNYTGDYNISELKTQYPAFTNRAAAGAMLRALSETEGGPILVAWESYNIQFLLGELGVVDAPSWPYGTPDEYDRMFQLTFENIDNSWTLKGNHHILNQNFSDAVAIQQISKELATEAAVAAAMAAKEQLDKVKELAEIAKKEVEELALRGKEKLDKANLAETATNAVEELASKVEELASTGKEALSNLFGGDRRLEGDKTNLV